MAEDNITKDNSSHDLISKLIAARSFSLEELEPTLDYLPDEGLFANIDTVAQRLRNAVFQNEPMVIFGHDDPDGITSTYILYNFLNSCGYQKHHYFIPNRNFESHGIQQGFVDFVRKGGYKLVVTVDNGISAWDGVEKLKALGCDVIITDHHLVQPETIPDAYAIVNPQLPECRYPFKALAGVGVVLMLIRYLSKVWEHPVDPASYFWTAVGSIADKVPMIGVNRLIVRHVLENFHEVQDETVDFLLRNYNRINSLTDIHNFLQYTSRLIANGRESGGQHTAMRFILQLSDAKARLFQDLEKQKNTWELELNRIFGFLDTLGEDFVGNYFVYYDDEDVIPYPLLGTAATYIVNKLRLPTIMLKHHNGDTVCEGRCQEGFNMVDAFTACKGHLKQYGGHPRAAGFTMVPASYDAFLDCFNSFVNKYTETAKRVELSWEAEINVTDLNQENWNDLELLMPWGQMNPEPTLLIRNVTRNRLLESLSLDNGGIDLPATISGNALVLWKAPNLVKVLNWKET
jgi:single-stranded-DNA-specific exonuclease